MEELQATRNINDFRKRAGELGLVTYQRNLNGGWCHRSRADILEDCCRWRVLNGVPDSAGGLPALKRRASYVSSNDGPLLSGAAVEELEATHNINDFRKHAREVGLVTKHRDSNGWWHYRSRRDILEDCRQRLNVQGRDEMKKPAFNLNVKRYTSRDRLGTHPGQDKKKMLHDSSLKRPASHLSSNGVLDSAGCVPEPLISAMRNATADGNHAAGEVEDSVMSAEDLKAITDPDVFRKTAFKLGLTVRFKPPDGSNYKCRCKAYIVEDYRQQLADIAEADLPLRQCIEWYKEASR